MMDARKLRYFLYVAESLNVTRAAEKAHVTQPALSRQLRVLEQEIGVKLFERRARGIHLTEAGVRLHARARSLIDQLNDVTADLTAAATEPSGTLTIAVPPSLQAMVTTAITAHFSSRWPTVRIKILEGMSTAMRDAVLDGRADLAVISTREPAESLERQYLLSEHLVLFGSPADHLSMSTPVSIGEIDQSQLILTPFPNSLRKLVDDAFTAAGMPGMPQIEVELAHLMIELVRQHCGRGILPYCAIHDHLAAGRLQASPIANLKITWAIATSRERPKSVAAKMMIELIRKHCAAMIQQGRWQTALFIGDGNARKSC